MVELHSHHARLASPTLQSHSVGIASVFHSSAHVTFDLAITPERSIENLTRLSAAPHALDEQNR
ncbi:MAG: hypothetical protein ABIY48_01950 [Acidimicrobiales bacterium]